MSKLTNRRPDPDVEYLTIYDVNGNERFVTVENVYLPGDDPEEECRPPTN